MHTKERLQEYLEDAELLYSKLSGGGKCDKGLEGLRKRIEAYKELLKQFYS